MSGEVDPAQMPGPSGQVPEVDAVPLGGGPQGLWRYVWAPIGLAGLIGALTVSDKSLSGVTKVVAVVAAGLLGALISVGLWFCDRRRRFRIDLAGRKLIFGGRSHPQECSFQQVVAVQVLRVLPETVPDFVSEGSLVWYEVNLVLQGASINRARIAPYWDGLRAVAHAEWLAGTLAVPILHHDCRKDPLS
jgi:hypothetical protein